MKHDGRREFSVVVAAAKSSRGIGRGGQLPWTVRADMQYFKQLTRSTAEPTKRNAVVMGRKTWQSIPTKFRPLADRLNVVVSGNENAREEFEIPDSVLLVSSFDEALTTLCAPEHADDIEHVYVIGGGSIYAEAIKLPDLCRRVFLTEIGNA